jgi:hypothetical protein
MWHWAPAQTCAFWADTLRWTSVESPSQGAASMKYTGLGNQDGAVGSRKTMDQPAAARPRLNYDGSAVRLASPATSAFNSRGA